MNYSYLQVNVKNSEGKNVRRKVVSGKMTFVLPFNSEYSISLKSGQYFKGAIDVFLDGTSILGGNKMLIEPNKEYDIDRFCIDGDLEKGNKLKFVSVEHGDVQDPTSEKNGGLEIRCYMERRKTKCVTRGNGDFLGFSGLSGHSGGPRTLGLVSPQSAGGSLGGSVDQFYSPIHTATNWPSGTGIVKDSANLNEPVIANCLESNVGRELLAKRMQDNLRASMKQDAIPPITGSNEVNAGEMYFEESPVEYEVEVGYTIKNPDFLNSSVLESGATVEGSASSTVIEKVGEIEIDSNPFATYFFDLKGGKTPEVKVNTSGRYTNYVNFVLDESGSMSSVRQETIKAFNTQLEVLKNAPENVDVFASLYKFNQMNGKSVWKVFSGVPVKQLTPITEKEYVPGGGTPMLDAVGDAITDFEDLDIDDKTSFLVIVLSDGEENSSHFYDYGSISDMIVDKQNTGVWTFTYMGANQNLAEIQENMKIEKGNLQVFAATKQGVNEATGVLSASNSAYYENVSRGISASASYYKSE